MKVIKRNKAVVDFDKSKIKAAILKAFKEVDNKVSEYAEAKAENIANYIEELAASNSDLLTVEEIQDIVEKGLMATKRKDVAKAYVIYRYKRQIARTYNEDFFKAVREKIIPKETENSNANVDEASFGGRTGEANNVLMKKFALDNCVSAMAKRNHENNEIYIHDLNSYAVGCPNCLSIPFDDLLAKGFNTRQTDVRPANSINTAFQLLAVIFQLQSLQQFGGCSATHLDWTMVPYVRKSFYKHFRDGVTYMLDIDFNKYEGIFDITKTSIEDQFYHTFDKRIYKYALDMTQREIKQAVEGMYHNLNTLQSRSGNQLK